MEFTIGCRVQCFGVWDSGWPWVSGPGSGLGVFPKVTKESYTRLDNASVDGYRRERPRHCTYIDTPFPTTRTNYCPPIQRSPLILYDCTNSSFQTTRTSIVPRSKDHSAPRPTLPRLSPTTHYTSFTGFPSQHLLATQNGNSSIVDEQHRTP